METDKLNKQAKQQKYGESETDKHCKTDANSPTSSILLSRLHRIAAMAACELMVGLLTMIITTHGNYFRLRESLQWYPRVSRLLTEAESSLRSVEKSQLQRHQLRIMDTGYRIQAG